MPDKLVQDVARMTDFLTLPVDTEIAERSECFVVRSPRRQDYVFGNYIALKEELTEPLDAYCALWSEEFRFLPGVETMTLQWATYKDLGDQGHDSRWASMGVPPLVSDSIFSLANFVGDSASRYLVKRLDCESDWNAVMTMLEDELNSEDVTHDFVRWRMSKWRELVELGRGEWWSVQIESTVIGTAGVFWTDDKALARLQSVVTRTSFFRTGVATQLLCTMIRNLLECSPKIQIITVAESNSFAEDMYRKLGFSYIGRQLSWTRRKEYSRT